MSLGTAMRILLAVLLSSTVVAAQRCSVKRGGVPGDCVPLRNCERLKQEFRPFSVSAFIGEHSCGVEHGDGDVLVCCPRVIAASGGVFSGPADNSTGSSCGKRKVNNGAEWPFVVGLGFEVERKDLITVICNGVLITPQWVLTGAHCFTQYHITTAFFSMGLADYLAIERVPVVQRRRPSDYDAVRDHNAVALAKLAAPVTISDNIQLVCMPPIRDYRPPGARYVLYIGKFDDGSVAGGFEVRSLWKHEVALAQCRASSGIAVFPTVAHVCTNGLQACNIPMNRPLLVGLNGNGDVTILGLAGLTADRCTSDVTSFTEVSKYLPWIDNIINPQTDQAQLIESGLDFLNDLANVQGVQTCGRRVVGKGKQWPFTAAIGFGEQIDPSNNKTWIYTSHCTGAILEPTWVLTDVRCLANKKDQINYVSVGYQTDHSATVGVKAIHTPPYDSLDTVHNTVALVELSQPLIFSDNVQSVCLDDQSSHDNSSLLHALSAGYGFKNSEVRLTTGLEVVGRTGIGACLASRFVTFQPNQPDPYICTSNIRACEFLATPPMVVEEGVTNTVFSVVGVGGDNSNYCNADFIAFVRVKPHVKWINSVLHPNGNPKLNIQDFLAKFGQPQSQEPPVVGNLPTQFIPPALAGIASVLQTAQTLDGGGRADAASLSSGASQLTAINFPGETPGVGVPCGTWPNLVCGEWPYINTGEGYKNYSALLDL